VFAGTQHDVAQDVAACIRALCSDVTRPRLPLLRVVLGCDMVSPPTFVRYLGTPRIDYFDSDRDEDQVPSSPRESDVDVNVDIELLDSDRDEDQAPSSPQGFGVDVNIDIELLDSDRDETPPGPYIHSRQGSNGSLSPGDGARDRRVPDPPPVTRTYHPKLNGKSSLPLVLHIFIKRLL
jgi:hypothetical protein